MEPTTLTELLREALTERAQVESLHSIERKTGVANPHLSCFLRHKASFSLASVEKLLPYLGITVSRRRPRRASRKEGTRC